MAALSAIRLREAALRASAPGERRVAFRAAAARPDALLYSFGGDGEVRMRLLLDEMKLDGGKSGAAFR